MNNRGKLWIVPNESQDLLEVFERDVENRESYISCIQEFSNMYKVELIFQEEDYNLALYELTLLGNIVIKTDNEESSVVCYLPDKITINQYDWLYQNSNMLNNYKKIRGNSIFAVNQDGICWKKLNNIKKIMEEARKNIEFSKKGKVM